MNDYQKYEAMIEKIKTNKRKPTLLLHACCAPCSSSVLEQLTKYFHITIYFYNPNITSEKEYRKRKEELKRFLSIVYQDIQILDCDYNNEEFLTAVRGLEEENEGGKRCYNCYELRLEKTAGIAKQYNFDYFTTTLSISPYKNSKWLNEIGQKMSEKYHINYLYADFKKKDGYKRSIDLSKQYALYRQDYCGCVYSKMERQRKKFLTKHEKKYKIKKQEVEI